MHDRRLRGDKLLSKDEVRKIWCEVYTKSMNSGELTEMEAAMASIIALHPEYEWVLGEVAVAVTHEFSIDCWESNPFLHLSLHLAIAEQLKSGGQNDVHEVFAEMAVLADSRHEAEHFAMGCLAASISESRRKRTALTTDNYLKLLRQKLEDARSASRMVEQ
jgi:Domain of unknown function (DUF1841)